MTRARTAKLDPRFRLGTRLRDDITGHEGVATMVRCELGGIVTYLVEGKTGTDGHPREFWCEESRLSGIEKRGAGFLQGGSVRHARTDYQARIVDLDELIPEQEPVFLLRGQDTLAPMILLQYAKAAADMGAQPELVQSVYDQAALMGRWQIENGHKVPDVPVEALSAVIRSGDTAQRPAGDPVHLSPGETDGTPLEEEVP